MFVGVCLLSIEKGGKSEKIQKQCVFMYIGTCVPWMGFGTNCLSFVSLVT